MTLDPVLWEALETHGVSAAHLEMLLRLLQVQRAGSWTWHYVRGQLSQCEVKLSFPARSYEVARVAESLLGDGNSLPR
jgi:hypothetical protein